MWVAPVAFAIVLLSRKWQELLAKKYMTTRIDLSEGIQECLETVQDIKACNQEKTYLEKLDAKLDAAEKRRFPVKWSVRVFLQPVRWSYGLDWQRLLLWEVR